jgi:hypothetical protein
MSMSRKANVTQGIYLVANRESTDECLNLIYSIRRCGCKLPIRIIPFGGKPLALQTEWEDVRLLSQSDFPSEGLAFVDELHRRIPQCPLGFLRRFLCWFGEFDEFLYSDNDIVALMNWEELFPYLDQYELVHADKEFTAKGQYNFRQPARFEELMGQGKLDLAVTAGHFLCRRKPQHNNDLLAGLAWMEAHPEVPIWHDQALLHVTIALAQWRTLNLCMPPNNWADSHVGSYGNILDLIRAIQVERRPFSHLHFSGGAGNGTQPIEELLHVSLTAKQRKQRLLSALLSETSGLHAAGRLTKRAMRKVRRMAQENK